MLWRLEFHAITAWKNNESADSSYSYGYALIGKSSTETSKNRKFEEK
jgi:hypothetical protein